MAKKKIPVASAPRVTNAAAPAMSAGGPGRPRRMAWTKLRSWQQDAVRGHRDARAWRLDAPTGAGKSWVMIVSAAEHLAKGGRVLIAVPTHEVSASFDQQTEVVLSTRRRLVWHPQPAQKEGKIQQILDFLKSKGPGVLIVTHNALGRLVDQIQHDPEILRDTYLIVDEAHHARDDEGEGDGRNRMGALVRTALDMTGRRAPRVMLVTATFFRGDRRPILGDDLEKLFEGHVYRRSVPDHMAQAGIKKVHFHLLTWRGPALDFPRHVKRVYTDFQGAFDTNKGIVYVPHSSTSFYDADHPKEVQVKLLAQVLGAVNREVLDVVTPKDQAQNQALLFDQIRAETALRKDFDTILAMQLVNEGVDLPAADHVIIVGARSSLTRLWQMAGRTLRKFTGKHETHVFLMLPMGLGAGDTVEFNRFLKAVHMLILGNEVFRALPREVSGARPSRDTEERGDVPDTVPAILDDVRQAVAHVVATTNVAAGEVLSDAEGEAFSRAVGVKAEQIALARGASPEEARAARRAGERHSIKLLQAGVLYHSDAVDAQLVRMSSDDRHHGIPITRSGLEAFRVTAKNCLEERDLSLETLLTFLRTNGRRPRTSSVVAVEVRSARTFARCRNPKDAWFIPEADTVFRQAMDQRAV